MMKKTMKCYFLTLLNLLLFCSNLLGKDIRLNDYPYKDVNFTQVELIDDFWRPRIQTSKTVTIPYAFRKCEETGRIDNFAIAAKQKEGKYRTSYPFDDSDVYKIMEGASFVLAVDKDSVLDHYLDELIALIGKSQEPDGYLFTNRTINNPPHVWIGNERWSNEWDNSHETYNAGHLYEAAVAHFLSTGKRTFLDIAIKNADLMCATFNPNARSVAPGHEVIEMGLVKLYRVTGNPKYLDLSRFFLEARGKSNRFDSKSTDLWRNGEYWQDHLPVTQQKEAVGHAVRATYLYSAMADIAAIMQDSAYLSAIDAIWNNIVSKKIYITGGIGATSHGEAFGKNYDLPNASAYCETCAAIGNCMFNYRMFLLHGNAKYIDVLERSLYNGVLSGIDLSGDKFFYPNPLEVGKVGQKRSFWFDCSCCPSNLARFIPSVAGYMYATDRNSVYLNLFASSKVDLVLNNNKIKITQETKYPWSGEIILTIDQTKRERFNLKIRIPGWSNNQVLPSDLYEFVTPSFAKMTIRVNKTLLNYKVQNGYAVINRRWKSGDKINVSIPLEPRIVRAHANVEADRDKLSVICGPLVYCAEFADNNGLLSNRTITCNTQFIPQYDAELLGGVVKLIDNSIQYSIPLKSKGVESNSERLILIPYFLRSHRGEGEMAVWLSQKSDVIKNRYISASHVFDFVIIGNPQSEKEHNLQGKFTRTGGGVSAWRDAVQDGWFSYDMSIINDTAMDLVLTYNSLDGGNRFFEIFADDYKIGEQKLRTETFSEMIELTYSIPQSVTKDKKKVTIKIKAVPGNIAGGVWGCKIKKRD